MAINKKLIHFNNYSDFKTELDAGNILGKSIVFIKDTQQIYTHGKLYSCSEYNDTEIKNRVANLEAIDHSQFLKEHQDISGKVDKVTGKELSTNDYTNEEKAKLEATPTFWIGTLDQWEQIEPKDNNTFYFIIAG